MWGGKSLIFYTLFHLVRSILTDPFRMIGPKWSKEKNLLLKPGLQVAMLKLGSSSSNIVGRVELRIAVLVQFGGGRTLYTACVTNY